MRYSILRKTLARGAIVCLLALFGSCLSLATAQADSCSDHDSDAVRASSDPKFDFVVQSRGDVCVIADYDDQSQEYYSRSERRCRRMPGMIQWQKDQGAGYNLCIFSPPSGSTTNDDDTDSDTQSDMSSDDDNDTTEYDLGGGGTPAPSPSPSPSKQRWFSAKVCNKSGITVNVSVAGKPADKGGRWVVKGWWVIESGGCANVGRFYRSKLLIHGEGKNRVWSGPKQLCTRSKKFWYYAEGGQCSERISGFFERSIPSHRDEWTETLVYQ